MQDKYKNHPLLNLWKQADLKGVELMPHQTRVAEKFEKSPKGLTVIHSMGSGKTFTALNAIGNTPTDVVVPAPLVPQWEAEAKRVAPKANLRIMSHDKWAKGVDNPRKYLIVDEVHKMTTPGTARANALKDQSMLYDKRLLMTGTPIKNHPGELHTILSATDALHPKYKSLNNFNKMIVKTETIDPGFWGRFKNSLTGTPPEKKTTVGDLTALTGLNPLNVDFHEVSREHFPDVEHIHRVLQRSPEQARLQALARSQSIDPTLSPLEQQLRLNMFLNKSRQLDNSVGHVLGSGLTPKQEAVMSDIQKELATHPKAKSVVYSNFLDAGVMPLADALTEKGISTAVFDGSLSPSERARIKDLYNTGKIKTLFITGAGTEGLDLKGSTSMHMLESTWNSAKRMQAEARVARYKSHEALPPELRNVRIYHYNTGDDEQSADQILNSISERKDQIIEPLMTQLSRISAGNTK